MTSISVSSENTMITKILNDIKNNDISKSSTYKLSHADIKKMSEPRKLSRSEKIANLQSRIDELIVRIAGLTDEVLKEQCSEEYVSLQNQLMEVQPGRLTLSLAVHKDRILK